MSPARVYLKEWRAAKGLTKYALAKDADVRRATIIELEKGPREKGRAKRVSLDVLEKLAKALGVKPGDLLAPPPK